MNSLVLHSIIVLYYVTVWLALLPLMLKPTKNVKEDERLTTMRSIGTRYLTIWNLSFQTAVFVGYFICDILEVQQKYSRFRIKYKQFLDEFFYSIIGPTSTGVVIIFWIFYSYDPGSVYIYPNLIVDTLTPWANHTMHTNILPLVLLQAYHNKASPVEHSTTQKRLMILIVSYIICLYGTYFQKNVWVYPFLNYLFEPVRFFLLITIAVIQLGINFVFYRLNEWYCNSSFGGAELPVKREKEVTKSK